MTFSSVSIVDFEQVNIGRVLIDCQDLYLRPFNPLLVNVPILYLLKTGVK